MRRWLVLCSVRALKHIEALEAQALSILLYALADSVSRCLLTNLNCLECQSLAFGDDFYWTKKSRRIEGRPLIMEVVPGGKGIAIA
jgi:hypothetical protein